jgi:TRAP-type C4-dicarboxylate transport system permease small subunit
MIEQLRRMDRAWARGEGWLTVLVLILMVLVAGFAAGVRNLTRFDVAWANEMLTEMEWADSLLRKGTLWLAFLGASLATYSQKHINIDWRRPRRSTRC